MSTETETETTASVTAKTEAFKANVKETAEYYVSRGDVQKNVSNAALNALGLTPIPGNKTYQVDVPFERFLRYAYTGTGGTEAALDYASNYYELDVQRGSEGRTTFNGSKIVKASPDFDLAAALKLTADEETGSDITPPALKSLDGTFTDDLARAKAELALLQDNVKRVLIWLCRNYGLCGDGLGRAADRMGLEGFDPYPKSVRVEVPASGVVSLLVDVFPGEDAGEVAAELASGKNTLGQTLKYGHFRPDEIKSKGTVKE